MSDTDHRDSHRRDHRKRALISQEAAEWFARLKESDVSVVDRRRFVHWLKESKIHVAEYLIVAGVDGDLRAARLTASVADDDDSNVVKLHAREGEPSQSQAEAQAQPAGSWRWRVAAAASIFTLGSLLLMAARIAWLDRTVETELGEWKTVILADGSTAQLGPDTLLKVDLSDARRSVQLLRGEAYFQVAKDPSRPFLVTSSAFSVRAVGTEFAVSRRKDELIVTVAEGVVRVAPSRGAARGGNADSELELSVPIVADYQLRVSHRWPWPVAPTRVDVQYELAWKDKRLMFQSGDTLADAIEEFNFRNRVKLVLDSGAPGELSVRGNFDASDPRSFAATMDRIPTIRVVEVSSNVVRMMAE